jgi:hypothetical protein
VDGNIYIFRWNAAGSSDSSVKELSKDPAVVKITKFDRENLLKEKERIDNTKQQQHKDEL